MSVQASELAPSTQDAVEFLMQWQPTGFWTLSAIDPTTREIETLSFDKSERAEAAAWIVRWNGTRNLYWMPNTPKRRLSRKATKEDIAFATCQYVDIDARPPPPNGIAAKDWYIKEFDRILGLIQAYPQRPTVIVFTGGGYQCLWPFDKPYEVEGKEDRDKVEARNKKIAKDLGGDACHSIEHIMRLPGTWNLPTPKKLKAQRVPVLARVHGEPEWDRLYLLHDFKPWVEPAQPKAKASDAPRPRREPTDEIKDLIANGFDGSEYADDRSRGVLYVCCECARHGWSRDEVKATILDRTKGISKHIYDQGNPQKYAQRQVDRAFDAVAADPRHAQAKDGNVIIKSVASYEMENYRWLWLGWLARGKQHLLAGPPGVAKTTLALRMAATVSMGNQWPDKSHAPPGDVVMWTGEDNIADTIKPRLVAMGADTSRIHILQGVEEDGMPRDFNPATDIKILGPVFERVQPSLLIIDPISNAITGDSHKSAEVRRDLQPLVSLIERYDVAALGITHFNKGSQGKNPMERVMASVAFVAGPRLVMVAVKPAEDGAPSRLARAKSNIGPDGGGFEFSLVQTHVREDSSEVEIAAQKIEWGGVLEGTARELLDVEEPEGGSALEEAKTLLLDMLGRGPRTVEDITGTANSRKIAWRTIERAKKALKIKSIKPDLVNGWQWALPDDEPQ